ncbi:MAG TPA: hypothetical protein VF575_01150 [Candidatus Saccharimonadales bacterium]|jgi:hypothetical protein
MNYIKELAGEIHGQIPAEVLPEAENLDELMLMYAVLALAKHTQVTNEDVHNVWAAWMSFNDPEHRSIKPYDELEPDVQEQDTPFTEAIRRAVQ